MGRPVAFQHTRATGLLVWVDCPNPVEVECFANTLAKESDCPIPVAVAGTIVVAVVWVVEALSLELNLQRVSSFGSVDQLEYQGFSFQQ
eukprot:scaffold1253_cov146-Amphora_coffeaeformis.AAC.1